MNILITGISKGLGLETAKSILEKGHSVYGINRSLTPELIDLQNRYPETLKFKQFDLVESENVHKQIFKEWIGFENPIHGFVNNAAIAYDDIITNLNLDPLTSMFKVNVFSPFILTKYVIRQMLFHKIKGSILHISSISVHTGYKGLAMYASTKGALEAFSKNTAREWGGIGIRSNSLVAGFMETEMSSTLSNDKKNRIYNRTSLKKPVNLNSVVDTIYFLLSDNACSITGQNIHVDNGTI
jgi:3-oxoacyl-[acyl-carrier protein] reductase